MRRTTITINGDILDELRLEAAKDGSRPFKAIINEALRLGHNARRSAAKRPKFKVKAKDLGTFPGIDYDNVGGLLDRLDGPDRKW